MQFGQQVAVCQGELRPIQKAPGGLRQVSRGVAIDLVRQGSPQEIIKTPQRLQQGFL